MTPYQKFTQAKLEEKTMRTYLDSIKKRLKRKGESLQAYLDLLDLDSDSLPPICLVRLTYLKAKYFTLQFRNSEKKDVELLLKANDFYDDGIVICRQHNIRASAKMHFSRCHTKILLSIHHPKEQERHAYLHHAEKLVKRSLEKYGSDPQFDYLKSKLAHLKTLTPSL